MIKFLRNERHKYRCNIAQRVVGEIGKWTKGGGKGREDLGEE